MLAGRSELRVETQQLRAAAMAPPKQRIVMKFGGTSMAGIERIRSVAARVRGEAEACVALAAQYTWESCTKQFLSNLVPVR